MGDRHTRPAFARRLPRCCMGGAHPTSASSASLAEFAEVAPVTCSPGAVSQRSRKRPGWSKVHIGTPMLARPHARPPSENVIFLICVVLRSTAKHPHYGWSHGSPSTPLHELSRPASNFELLTASVLQVLHSYMCTYYMYRDHVTFDGDFQVRSRYAP